MELNCFPVWVCFFRQISFFSIHCFYQSTHKWTVLLLAVGAWQVNHSRDSQMVLYGMSTAGKSYCCLMQCGIIWIVNNPSVFILLPCSACLPPPNFSHLHFNIPVQADYFEVALQQIALQISVQVLYLPVIYISQEICHLKRSSLVCNYFTWTLSWHPFFLKESSDKVV